MPGDIFSLDVLKCLTDTLAPNLVAPIRERDVDGIKKAIIGQFADTASRTQEWKTTFDGELASAKTSASKAASDLDAAQRQILVLQDALKEVRSAANRPDVITALSARPKVPEPTSA
jgi:hypothetical protein